MRALLGAAAGVLSLALGIGAQSARDAGTTREAAGSATVSGSVTTADATDPKPVRGAIVTINRIDRPYGSTSITDAQGRFVFDQVPAGRFQLAAEKEGFVKTRYGASRPGRAGVPIAVADGQRVENLALRLIHGSVLTGRVVGPDGDPVEFLFIELKQFVMIGGERRLVDVPADVRTDDRGIFRAYGLTAGEYIVGANVNLGMHLGTPSAIHQTTAADVAWANGGASPVSAEVSTAGYARVYYPGVAQQSAAAVIALGPGEERANLDMRLTLVPTFRVDGTVTSIGSSDADPAPGVFLVEVGASASDSPSVREAAGWRFSFNGVPAGQYVLAAVDDVNRRWATSEVSVAGPTSTTLTLQPGLTLSGQITLQGTAAPPTDLALLNLSLEPIGANAMFMLQPSTAHPKADGSFVIGGLLPGKYRLRVPSATALGGSWSLRSALVGDQDIADVPIEVRADAPRAAARLTFTDRPTELSGVLTDPSARATADYFVIAFSTDDRTWLSNARRIAQTRPDSAGKFIVRGLPPGDYYIAALTDVERNEWYDAAFLRSLVPNAIKLSLGEGEKKTQDIKIAK